MRDDILDAHEEPKTFEHNNTTENASFLRRLAAFIVDFIVVFPIAFLLYLSITYFKSPELYIFLCILFFSYKPFMEIRYGATFGKEIFKIKVVDKQYQFIGIGSALIRNFPWILIGLWNLYTFVYVFYNNNHRPNYISQSNSIFSENTLVIFGMYIVIPSIILNTVLMLTSTEKRSLGDYLAKAYCRKIPKNAD